MRKKSVRRKTRETDVRIDLRLDGPARYEIAVSDKWLRHMLESLARFGRFGLTVRASGDLSHHVVEDVAIALGGAFRDALQDRPVRRVGNATLPMDEALVTVAVDLVDRPYCQVDVPDEMLEHFLRSFAMEARMTLHSVKLRGRNAHHINEATFKALGVALHEATRPAESLCSTKGPVRWKR